MHTDSAMYLTADRLARQGNNVTAARGLPGRSRLNSKGASEFSRAVESRCRCGLEGRAPKDPAGPEKISRYGTGDSTDEPDEVASGIACVNRR